MTIRVYTTPSCAQCMLTKKWLTDRGIPFETVDLADPAHAADYAAIKALGYTSAPVVVVGSDYEVHWSGLRPDLLAEHCAAPKAAA